MISDPMTVSPPQMHGSVIHPQFESLVQRVLQEVEKDRLAELRKDFHVRLRLTLTHPERTDLIEDLWDFFYDWCFFEQKLPETCSKLGAEEVEAWNRVKDGHQRGLFTVAKTSEDGLRLKELYVGKTYFLKKAISTDLVGISKGDVIEARLLPLDASTAKDKPFIFARRPSYHPLEIHGYLKKKVRQFKRAKDYASYQNWLWLLVGMYLKHRIYDHMPIDKIYDDNSRI